MTKKTEFAQQGCRQMTYLDSFNDTHFPMHFKDSMEKCSNVRLHQATQPQQLCDYKNTGMLKGRARRWHSFLKHSPQKLGIFIPLKVLLLPLHSVLTKYFRGTQPLKTNFHNKIGFFSKFLMLKMTLLLKSFYKTSH